MASNYTARYGHQMTLEVPEDLYNVLVDMCDGDIDQLTHCATRCLAEGIERINGLMVGRGHDWRVGRYLRSIRKFKRQWCAWYLETCLENDDGE